MGVGLRPRGGDVDRAVGRRHGRGPEAIVDAGLAAERLDQAEVVAGHDDVEVGALGPAQRVADRAADQIGVGSAARRRLAHPFDAWQRRDPGREALGLDLAGRVGHRVRQAGRGGGAVPYHDAPPG